MDIPADEQEEQAQDVEQGEMQEVNELIEEGKQEDSSNREE